MKAFPFLISRSKAKKWLKKGFILVNGEQASPQRYPKTNDIIEVFPPQVIQQQLSMKLMVHHLDDHLAIIEKPAGIHVSGNFKRTIRKALPHNIPASNRFDALPQAEPVHRLDRRTSGLLLIARTATAQIQLGQMFEKRQIQKTYRALVLGKMIGNGALTKAINTKDAVTKWKVLHHARSLVEGWLTEVEVQPITGRTHQIRIHLSEIGHPIVGDDLYTRFFVHDDEQNSTGKQKYVNGSKRTIYRKDAVFLEKGLFLAAIGLSFEHPISKQRIELKRPSPNKFEAHRIRESRRWDKYNNESKR